MLNTSCNTNFASSSAFSVKLTTPYVIGTRQVIHKHIGELRKSTSQLVHRLQLISDLARRSMAITRSNDGAWIPMPFEDFYKQLSIFQRFSYSEDQESRSTLRLPAVIQVHPKFHSEIRELVAEINEKKTALKSLNAEMKRELGKESSQVWQKVVPMASILQILRSISVFEGEIEYLGLSYLTKPSIKKLTKEAAQELVGNKIQYYAKDLNFAAQMPILQDLKRKLAEVSESKFDIRLARKGAPRTMLNITSKGKQHQLAASLPVFVFSDDIVKVSLPSGAKRKPRSDKKIPIGEAHDFGIYLLPKGR